MVDYMMAKLRGKSGPSAPADPEWHRWLHLAGAEAKRRFNVDLADLYGARSLKRHHWEKGHTVEEAMAAVKAVYGLVDIDDLPFNPKLPGAPAEASTLKKQKAGSASGKAS